MAQYEQKDNDGAAFPVDSKTEDWHDPDLSAKFLYWYMVEYCIYDEDSAKRRIDDILRYEDVYIRRK